MLSSDKDGTNIGSKLNFIVSNNLILGFKLDNIKEEFITPK